MVSPEWVEEQMVYLTARIGIYRPDAREKFFFEPIGGFYGLIAQGSTEALNDGMRMLADHIQCIGCPVIQGWEGQENPLVLADHDWASDNEPPGLICHTSPYHSRIRLAIVSKHVTVDMPHVIRRIVDKSC